MITHCLENNGITRGDMEAMLFAKSTNFILRNSEWEDASAFVADQFPADIPGRLAMYRRGYALLSLFVCIIGSELDAPLLPNGTPADKAVSTAPAWLLIECGKRHATPVYRFVRFYHRKAH